LILLGIESSCDETAAALLKEEAGRQTILADHLASQVDLHQKYGGVVPELACRRHIEVIGPLVAAVLEDAGVTLSQVDAIAVTAGPGLIGALLVGVSYAKALAYALEVPLLAVHHLAGHIHAAFIEHSEVSFPALALVVSGGHTNLYYMTHPSHYELMGKTIDDAAGEALDKGARMLGLGYPGGPIIDRLARNGDPEHYTFPRPYRSKAHHNFSFSGLKTALKQALLKASAAEKESPKFQTDMAASYQAAVIDSLVEKTIQAARQKQAASIILCGGVAANSRLRQQLSETAAGRGIRCVFPSPRYCTDNGAMIAMVGLERFKQKAFAALNLNPSPNLKLEAVG